MHKLTNMKVLVLGGKGQLGYDVTQRCKEMGFDVVSLGRGELDVTNFDVLSAEIRKGYDIVFNCTGYNAVDGAEDDPQGAFAVNMFAVGVMARECQKTGAVFVHVSTDYVFDGEKGKPYTESDKPSPQSVYALSKLGGELMAKRALRHMVVRSGGLYGIWGSRFSARSYRNFPERVIETCERGGRMMIVKDRYSAPTWTGDLARKMVEIAVELVSEKSFAGIWHMMQKGVISWYDFAVLTAKLKGFDDDTIARCIVPTTSEKFRQKAQRPRFSVLENSRLEQIGKNDMLTIPDALKKYIELRRKFEAG